MKYILLLLTTLSIFASPYSIIKDAENNTVSIQISNGFGSGVLVTKENTNGDKVSFVLTAAHVVAGLRDEEASEVTFSQMPVVVFLNTDNNNEMIGMTRYLAQVIKFSPVETNKDIAILKIRQKNTISHGVIFYDGEVKTDDEVFQFSSMIPISNLGAPISTFGKIGNTNETRHEKVGFYQIFMTVFMGSSGGGVFLLDNGKYIGMVTEREPQYVSHAIRLDEMMKWAKEQKIEWFFNSEKCPNDEEILKIPLLDN